MLKRIMDVWTPVMTVPQLLQLCTEEERKLIEPIIEKYTFREEA